MHDRSANFYDIQADFNLFYDSVMVGQTTIPKGKGIKQFKRWEYYWQNRIAPDGSFPTPGHTLREAQDYRTADAFRSYVTGTGNWEMVGPALTPTNGTGQPNGNGRINCIAFHPTDANTIFVGAPSGGLWKSTDNGSTWTEYSTGLVRLGVSSIVVHPTNPNTIYIGTGDRDGGDAPGYGVWRSTNGGSSWSSWNSGMGNRTVYEILMHPTNSNILIASTSSGRIYRSTNGGANWTYVSVGTNCKDIAFHPTDPNIVYGAGDDFVRSTDNGVSFTTITNGVPSSASRMAIGVSADEPNWIYLLAGNGNGLVDLVRSTNSGVSFSSRTTTPNILGWDWDGSDVGSQAWYDLVMIVNPNDANEIYTGGINIWKSTDGGSNMSLTAHWVGSGGADDVHADHHALEYSPHNGALYNGNDGGVYYSTNSGNTWTDISSGLAIAQVYKIGVSQTTEGLAINGYQDNGTAVNLEDAFRTEIGGDGMECIVDPTDANYMYGSLYYGDIRRSTNNGFNFGQISGGVSEDGGWVTPFKLDPSNENRMYAGYDNVWRTNNVKAGTVSWTQISNFGGTNNCVDLDIAPSNTNVVYVSRSSGKLYKTTNAQAGSPTWTDISGNLPLTSTPKDIEIDPLDEDHVFISQGVNIYESTDGGGSWTDISGSLPNISLNAIVIDRNSPVGAMYVGMDVGVYYRDNNSSDWEAYYTGLSNTEVTELEIYYNTTDCRSTLYAATYGQGLWKSDLKDPGTVAPIACFESDEQTGCVGTPVIFSDLSSYTPTNWTWTFSPNTVSFTNGTNANSQNPEVIFNATGLYTVTLTASNANGSDSETKTDYISVISNTLATPTLISPADAATGVTIPTAFSWSAVTGSGSPITYDLEIATDVGFSSIIDTQNDLTTNSYSTSSLSSNTTYYWRVKAKETCAESPFSSGFSFTTGNCSVTSSTDVPVTISNSGTPTVTSDLVVAAAGTITNVSVSSLDISHTWINDLIITLTSPGGTTVSLIDQICGGQDNINVILDDGATSSINAAPCPPTGGNSYQPEAALSAFNGETAAGTWVLTISDVYNADGGALNDWSLSICTNVPTCTDAGTPTLSLAADPVCPGASTTLTVSGSLNDATSWEVYTATNGGGTNVGSTTSTLSVSSTGSTTFYVRGEGGCTSPGPEASITLNGVDNTAPTITCPSNAVVNANALCNLSLADYTGSATVNDDCDGAPTVTQSPASGTTLSGYGTIQTVTLTATDASTNSDDCTFTVTVDDVTAPNAICMNRTVSLDASGSVTVPAVDINNTSTDNCGIASFSLSPNTFDCGDIGANSVTLTVTDNAGNSDNCTATVTVQDATNPTAACQNATVTLDGTGSATLLASSIDNGSVDNCSVASTSVSPSVFNCTNLGNQTVTLTVTDAAGNSDNCTATVTVQDATNPIASCQNTSVTLTGAGTVTLSAASVNNGSSDNCSVSSLSVSPSSFGCADIGNQTVTLTVTDAAGNSDNCTATVTINPHTADVASFDNANQSFCQNQSSAALPISGTGSTGGTYSSSPTGLSINPSTGVVDFSSSSLNTYTVNYTAPGPCGLTASTVLTVTSSDDASFSYAPGAYCVTDADPTPTITGISGGAFSFSPSGLIINSTSGQIDVSASGGGNYSVTYTTSGACSNSSSVSVTINDLDDASFSYGSSNYCSNSSDPTPTITGLAGGTFTATPSGLSIDSNSGEIDLDASAANSYSVTYTTSGPCPQSSSVSVTVDPLPAQPSAIAGLSPACPNSSQTYTIAPVTGATSYVWTLPAGWNGTSTSTSIVTSTTNTGGTITVAAVNGCGQSATPQSLAVSIINTDDGIPCTIDACNPANGAVTHTPDNSVCDDGLWCNGQETCDVLLGCQAGTPPVIDDGNSCTDDSCDEVNDQVVNVNNTDPCDDGNPFTINDQCVNGVCVGTPIGNVWTGNVNNIWGVAGNWSMFVPSSADDATIPTSPIGGVFPIIPSGFIADVNNVNVQNGASITVQAGGTLDVSGVLTNDGNIQVNDSGSLLQRVGSTLSGNGTYQVQRQGNTGQNFDYWSSPIVNQTGVPGTSYLYNSNASTQDDSDDAPADPGWTSYNGTMIQGVGYAGAGGGLATFNGTVGNGPINVPLIYHPFDNTYSQTSPGTPFNLVGNPYPSAIDATQFITDNAGIDGTLHFWDDDLSGGTGYHRTDYAYWNGTGGLGTGPGTIGAPNGFISTAQGFMVRALSNGATLNFNNGQRVAGSNNQFFRMNGADSRLWLSLEKDSLFNQILIGMLEDATFGDDRLYDAVKMRTNNQISLSAVANQTEHAILAFPPPGGSYTVPLYVNVQEDGFYDFRANTMESFDGYQVIFNDVETNLNVPLQEGSNINVYLTEGRYEDRFFLNFAQSTITGMEDVSSINLRAYISNGNLTLALYGNDEFNGQLELLDVSGRLVFSQQTIVLQRGRNLVQINNLSSGVYVVRVQNQEKTFTQKIVVE